ncbi:MAG: hypothetical protein JO362_15800 [Streptomycetaceae bacterium]|nr:hypothetical protein [Streptomycetaceae bacterium]
MKGRQPRQPFSEEMAGGRQMRLFDEETGPATTAGPAPGPDQPPTTDTDPFRTEPQP